MFFQVQQLAQKNAVPQVIEAAANDVHELLETANVLENLARENVGPSASFVRGWPLF